MKRNLTLFFKGVAMGIAEVIPGVSGGTLALITGIYTQLVNAIRAISLELVRALFTRAFWKELRTALTSPPDHTRPLPVRPAQTVAFFVVLMSGMVLAIVGSVRVIPALLHDFPEATKGLFLGLVLASILIPYRLMPTRRWSHLLLGLAVAAGTFLLMGIKMDRTSFTSGTVVLSVKHGARVSYPLTVPAGTRLGKRLATDEKKHSIIFETVEQVELTASKPTVQVAIVASRPGTKHNIEAGVLATVISDKHSPDGAEQLVPVIMVRQGKDWLQKKGQDPALWFIFICGAVAICAMILPGISGSFLLLMLGIYQYIIGGLRDLLYFKAWGNVLPLALFASGIIVGILAFSRLLAYLLKEFPAATMAVLIGLMIGSTRRLWPYQLIERGEFTNVMPKALDGRLGLTIASFVVGVVVVLGIEWIARKRAAAGN